LQTEIHSEDFVLTARRTEACPDARMKRRVRFVDLVTASESIRPNVAELIEVIVASAGDENQIVDLGCRFKKARRFLSMIAHERRLRPKSLQNERQLLSRIHPAVNKSGDQGQPRR